MRVSESDFPHDVIYLEPESCASSDTGPLWCPDDIGSEDENGTAVDWCKYIKASAVEAEIARLTARVRELELRLETGPDVQYDGIALRDGTIM